jgi:hypothetical protein
LPLMTFRENEWPVLPLWSCWFRTCNRFCSKVSTAWMHRRTNRQTHIYALYYIDFLWSLKKSFFKNLKTTESYYFESFFLNIFILRMNLN